MSWNGMNDRKLKKILALCVVLTMVLPILASSRLPCATNYSMAAELLNWERESQALMPVNLSWDLKYGVTGTRSTGAGAAPECSCKKKKSCPAIPRVALLPHMSSRSVESEHKKSATGLASLAHQICIGFVGLATARSGVLLLSRDYIFPSTDPTCTRVLLI